ncbi:restriction endonuclease subunit S [Bacteroidales bacterium SW292]|nr:restriction endonuclease subunit S [Bacteroidales bacterium SW292]
MELKDICQYISEKVATTTLTKENYISTENMLPDKGGIVTASGVPFGNSTAFSVGDVLVSNIRPYFKKIWQANRNGGCSADVLCFRANSNVDNSYFYYLLSQQEFFDYVMSGAKGCKMPRGDKRQIMQWKVELPSLDEQRHIASVLLSLDDKIELNRRINGNLEQQAQALYAKAFSSTNTCKMGDVVETTSGGTPSRKKQNYFSSQGIKWIKSKELNGTFIFDSEEHISNDGLCNSSAKLLPPNSTLIAMYGATVGAYGLTIDNATCNQAICALLPNSQYPYTYLYMWAKNNKDELIQKAIGSAQQNISQIIIKNMPVANEKDKIIRFDSDTRYIFSLMKSLAKENYNLIALRDALLPRLMSGELKINDLNR